MPTPTNKLLPPRVVFGRPQLRYALTMLDHTKRQAAKFADREIPTPAHAPALWVVRVVRSTLGGRRRESQMVLRQLGLQWRVGSFNVVKNTPYNNNQLERIAKHIELQPLRIREDPDLPSDRHATLLNSQGVFFTHPLKKSERLLELEKMYAEKLSAKSSDLLPPQPKIGDGRSAIEAEL